MRLFVACVGFAGLLRLLCLCLLCVPGVCVSAVCRSLVPMM